MPERGRKTAFPRAQFLLGEAYSRGLGVEQSDEEAARWYQSAAWLGYLAAQTELGRCLEFGTGLPQSIEQAVKWYRAAAENGNAPGQCCLGFLV
ncbi:MAG: tetratricopeptide repeat protein [Dysosmobacter welbionis]